VPHAPGNHQPLPLLEREGPSLDVDEEAALDDEEELVVGLVPVPVVALLRWSRPVSVKRVPLPLRL